MFAFVVYAMAVWYAAFRWRRHWGSLAAVCTGALGIAVAAWCHYMLGVWTDGEMHIAVLQSMLYSYAALVVGVGLYIARLPLVLLPAVRCRDCNYDMRSLDDPEAVCPECGRRLHPPRHAAIRVNPAAPAMPPRRRGPAPVVLRWPPVAAPGAVRATDR
jgi:hypothetical protein